MPGYDRTGPWGQGPRTGGGVGFCGTAAPDADTDGRGYGRSVGAGGRGRQRGFRRGLCFFSLRPEFAFSRPRGATPRDPLMAENTRLHAEAEELKRRLETVEQRLAGLTQPAEDNRPA
jgi:hypothetical protein